MSLNHLKKPRGSTKVRKRVGRGQGSGLGKTAGRGAKGQKARTGNMHFEGFEGGQMPLQRRLPKFGFTNPFRLVYEEVTVTDLGLLPAGSIVDAVALRGARLIRGKGDGVVVLGKGDVAGAYTVRVDRVTAGAREAIEKAGGKVDLVPPRRTMHEKRKSEKKAKAKA
jgi:large subunit ribosomal protein L15